MPVVWLQYEPQRSSWVATFCAQMRSGRQRSVPVGHSWETAECRWVPASQLAELELFGAFRETLLHLGLLD